MQFPKHEAGLYLGHNEHRDMYESVEQWIADNDEGKFFVSAEERAKAIAEDSVWSLQWYPVTPVGFYRVDASSLEAVLEAAAKIEAGE